MPNCWQNQEDSIIEQNFWKPVTAAPSNEESEIENKQEHQEINGRNHCKYFQEPEMNCLERENRLYGELEAIYKRIGTSGSNQTASGSVHLPVNTHLQASEASIGEEESMKMAKRRSKRKKKKDQLDSMAYFLESLVKQIMENQENLYRKFTQVIEKLDQERREREEAWKQQELAKFEQEAAARAREKVIAISREATIVSYLEKITGQRINLPPLKLQPAISENPFCTKPNSTSATDVRGDEEDETHGLKQNRKPGFKIRIH
ncbi:trihelix transcription factor GTL1-like [Olea europaea var. sylvestris]|nr:trihelix transcription factor GTL1-like [Olea europaea var. sylvestris]